MKFQIHFTIRKFDKDEEKNDSGYYGDLNEKSNGKIDINVEDDAFEQILTIYHEITHFVFDFISQYKLDDKNHRILKRNDTVKKDWRKLNTEQEAKRKDGAGIEELICCKVERAISPILRKSIPKQFFKKFFK